MKATKSSNLCLGENDIEDAENKGDVIEQDMIHFQYQVQTFHHLEANAIPVI